MGMAESIKDHVRFSPKEIDEFGIKDTPEGGVKWTKPMDFHYDFEDSEAENILKGIAQADQMETISKYNYALAKRLREELK